MKPERHLVFLAGLILISSQVTLLREAQISFGGNEIALVLGVGVWFLAAGLGVAHRPPRGDWRPAQSLLALAWCAVPSLVVARSVPVLLAGLAGLDRMGPPDLAQLLAGLALVLVFPGFVAGVVIRRLIGGPPGIDRESTRRWASFALGAFVGAVTAFAVSAMNASSTTSLCAAAVLGSAASAGTPGVTRQQRAVALAAALAAAASLAGASGIEEALTRWSSPGYLVSAETAHGRVVVAHRDGGVVVDIEGALAYEAHGTAAEEFAALAALQRATMGDVLMLGGWVEGLGGEVARYLPRSLTMVERDGEALLLAAPFLPPRPALREVIVADPRASLGKERRYDLIVSALPEPATGATSRAYSAEYFHRCAAALRDSGVLALRLRTQANVWTPREARRAAAVHAALVPSFPHIAILPGTDTVFLASSAPLTSDAVTLVRRLHRAAPATRVVSEGWLTWRVTNERSAELAALVERAEVPANRDRRPSCYADPILLDLARVFPGIGWRSPPAAGRWLWLALAVSFLPSLLARRRPGPRRDALAAYAGLAGAGMSAILMLHDQTGRAMLTRDLGAFLAVVIAGTAAGARVGGRVDPQARRIWWRPALVTVFSFWNGGLGFAMLAGASGVAFTSLALAVTGWLAGATFAAAGADAVAPGRAVVVAACLGVAAGMLVTGLFLVPFAGLAATALALAVLAFPAAVAVWPELKEGAPAADNA